MPAHLLDRLARHAERHPSERALTFPSRQREEIALSWSELWASLLQHGATLTDAGVKPGEVVLILTDSVFEQAVALLGAIAVGARPTILSFPSVKQSAEIFEKTFRPIVTTTEAQRVVCAPSFAEHAHAVELQLLAPPRPTATAPSVSVSPRDDLFLQFSSGTTGLRKGVVVTSAMFAAQMESVGRALGIDDDDVWMSWLPLYHDMGLVGALLTPLFFGRPSVHESPFDWLAEPSSFLRGIHEHQATLAYLPNFAFQHLANTVDAAALRAEGIRLDSLRGLFNCSEPVRARAFDAFFASFEPLGLRRRALQATYGLAESTFVATQTPVGEPLRIDRIEARAFEEDHRCLPADEKAHSLAFVSCGRPIEGIEVRVDGASEDRTVGEILLRGTSIFDGYFRRPASGEDGPFDASGWYRTGDLGYLADGDLFVTGRCRDLIIFRGSNIYPNDIEESIHEVGGVKPGRVAVFGVTTDSGTERLVAMAEVEPDADRTKVVEQARRIVVERHHVTIEVQAVEVGSLLKTTSGKVSRKRNRQRYLDEGAAPTPVTASAGEPGNHYVVIHPDVTLKDTPNPKVVEIVPPTGASLSLPRGLTQWLESPHTVEFLRWVTRRHGAEALVDMMLGAGWLVVTGQQDDFVENAFAARLPGPGSDSLIVQFRGGAYDLVNGVPPRDFSKRTGIEGHHLLMLRDLQGSHYLHGVSPELPSFDALVAWLRGVRFALPDVRNTYCLGTSQGGYAALLAAKRLRAEQAWAFSPVEPADAEPLADALREDEGGTVFHVWYGEDNANDRRVAESLADHPRVRLHGYPTSSHLIARVLWERNELPALIAPPKRIVAASGGVAVAPERILAVVREVVASSGTGVRAEAVQADTPLRGMLDSFSSTLLLARLSELSGAPLALDQLDDRDLESAQAVAQMLERVRRQGRA